MEAGCVHPQQNLDEDEKPTFSMSFLLKAADVTW